MDLRGVCCVARVASQNVEGEVMAKPKRGVTPMRVGLGMLVFGIVFAMAWSRDATAGLSGFAIMVAFFGLITIIVGFGIYREKPDAPKGE